MRIECNIQTFQLVIVYQSLTVEYIPQEFSNCHNKSKVHDNSVDNIENTRLFHKNGENISNAIWITVEYIPKEFSNCYNKSKIHDNSVENIENKRMFHANGEIFSKDYLNYCWMYTTRIFYLLQ